MATLDDLVVALTAETASFKRDIGSATKALSDAVAKMEGRAAKLDGAFNKVGASLKRAFTAGAILGAVTALVRMEDALEVSAAHLKDVALQAQVSYEALQRLRFAADQNGSSAEDMDTALSKLTKSIGQAAGGSKELMRVFHALGLEDMIQKGASTEAVFYALADALSQVNRPAERTAIVLALMGKSAGSLTDMMGQGASAVHEMADALPLAALKSDELINKLDVSHDKTEKFKEILSGLGSIAAGVFVDMTVALAELYGWLEKAFKITEKAQAAWEGFASVVGGSIDNIVSVLGDADPFKQGPGARPQSPGDVLGAFGPSSSGVGAKTKPRRGIRSGEVGSLFAPDSEHHEKLARRIDLVTKRLTQQKVANDALAEAEQRRQQIEAQMNASQQQLGEAFADALTNVATGVERWNDALKGLLLQIAQAIIKMTILKALGLESGSNIGEGLLKTLFGRATGGGVSARSPYIVGERGPELFVPDGAGRIADARGGDAGRSVNIVQNFHGGITGADLFAAISYAKREMKAAVKPMMIDAQRRGGLAGAFGR